MIAHQAESEIVRWRAGAAATGFRIAHEVAHLIEMNHSSRFWDIVEQLVPNHALRRKELRQNGYRYLVV